jgi:hypothetical protein
MRASFVVHRHSDASAQHGLSERVRRELATLVGISNFGMPASRECLFKYLDSMHCL